MYYGTNKMEVTKNKTLRDSIQNQKGEISWNEQKIVLNIQQETVHAYYKFWHTEKTKELRSKLIFFFFGHAEQHVES